MSAERIGPYRLVRPLGEGGMGQVFEAEPASDPNHHVALKVLHPLRERGNAQRLLDEARLGGLVRHPNVVTMLDFGMDGDRPYLVMELLRGRPLGALGLVPGAGVPVEGAVGMAIQALRGLSAAHQARDAQGRALEVVHRDIKPSNLFLTEDGVVKVIDFGIARVRSFDQTESRTGTLRGSVAYASPEQVRGEPLDVRSDLFSVGLVLHELLTGQRVFAQETDAAIITALLFSPLPPLRPWAREVSAALEEVLHRALAKDKASRVASAKELEEALTRALEPGTPWGAPQLAAWLKTRPAPTQAPRATATWARAPAAAGAPLAPGVVVAPPLPPAAASSPPKRRGRAFIALGGLLAVAAVGMGLWKLRAPEPAAVPPERPSVLAAPQPSATEPPKAEPPSATEDTAPARTESAPVEAKLPVSLQPNHHATSKRPPSAAEPAFLTVDAQPTYGRVFLDGRDVGLTPAYRLKTRAGKHQVQVSGPGGRTQRQTVVLRAAETRKLVFQW